MVDEKEINKISDFIEKINELLNNDFIILIELKDISNALSEKIRTLHFYLENLKSTSEENSYLTEKTPLTPSKKESEDILKTQKKPENIARYQKLLNELELLWKQIRELYKLIAIEIWKSKIGPIPSSCLKIDNKNLSPITTLPIPILKLIFDFLSTRDKFKIKRVNKKFRDNIDILDNGVLLTFSSKKFGTIIFAVKPKIIFPLNEVLVIKDNPSDIIKAVSENIGEITYNREVYEMQNLNFCKRNFFKYLSGTFAFGIVGLLFYKYLNSDDSIDEVSYLLAAVILLVGWFAFCKIKDHRGLSVSENLIITSKTITEKNVTGEINKLALLKSNYTFFQPIKLLNKTEPEKKTLCAIHEEVAESGKLEMT